MSANANTIARTQCEQTLNLCLNTKCAMNWSKFHFALNESELKSEFLLWSLSLLKMKIKLDSLWIHVEAMSYSLLLQYKWTPGMWRFNSLFELYGESIKSLVTLSVLDSVTSHQYLHSTVWMRGALCNGANYRLYQAPIDRQSPIISCLFDAFRV